MSQYTNCTTELFNTIYGDDVDDSVLDTFQQQVLPILNKHFPNNTPTTPTPAAPAAANPLLLMQTMLQAMATQPKKQSKRKGQLTPKNTIAQKEIFNHAAFVNAVKQGVITPTPILRKTSKDPSKVGTPIPVGWVHFVQSISDEWNAIKDLPEVEAALTQRQNEFQAYRNNGHPDAKYADFQKIAQPFVIPDVVRTTLPNSILLNA